MGYQLHYWKNRIKTENGKFIESLIIIKLKTEDIIASYIAKQKITYTIT